MQYLSYEKYKIEQLQYSQLRTGFYSRVPCNQRLAQSLQKDGFKGYIFKHYIMAYKYI